MIDFSSLPVIADFQILEALVGLAHERAVVLRFAAEPADFVAKLLDDPLALAARSRKISREALVFDVLRANSHSR